MAKALGIPGWKKNDPGLDHLRTSPGLEPISGIALGSATVSPINMANAYAHDRQRRRGRAAAT